MRFKVIFCLTLVGWAFWGMSAACAGNNNCIDSDSKRTPESVVTYEMLRVNLYNKCSEELKVKICIAKEDGSWSSATLRIPPHGKNYHETYHPSNSGEAKWWYSFEDFPRMDCDE